MNQKIKNFYSKSSTRFYIMGFIGFYLGAKLCDMIFYDPMKHQISRQSMQEQFWKLHGEPKHIKPQLVQSYLRPGTVRKSWIQIIYEKDRYIPKQSS